MPRALELVLVGSLTLCACEGGTLPRPSRDQLRQPTGITMTPEGRWLLIAGGNFDFEQSNGTLMFLDLAALHLALNEPPGAPGQRTSPNRPCRRVSPEHDTIECDPAAFIDRRDTVLFGSGLGSVAVDRPSDDDDNLRVLLTQRRPAAVAWADVVLDRGGIEVDCGQGEDGICDAEHQVRSALEDPNLRLPREPSRVVLDDQGARFAYVPHLLDGALTLIDLDSRAGPDISAVVGEFYRSDPFDDIDIAGGFSAAARPCDIDDPPVMTEDCTRPLVYSTHRWWPGVRQFTVATGLEVVTSNSRDARIEPVGVQDVVSRPFMGDLAFEDDTGQRLLVVQTTPPSLARVDTSVDDRGQPKNQLMQTVGLCNNPNLLVLHRPSEAEALALVSCFGDGEVAAVNLSTFTVIATVQVGAGANEMVVDAARRILYVANSQESTISLVSLDRRDPRFLTEYARLGLGAGSR